MRNYIRPDPPTAVLGNTSARWAVYQGGQGNRAMKMQETYLSVRYSIALFERPFWRARVAVVNPEISLSGSAFEVTLRFHPRTIRSPSQRTGIRDGCHADLAISSARFFCEPEGLLATDVVEPCCRSVFMSDSVHFISNLTNPVC